MSLPRALIAVAEGRQPEVLVPELASRSEQVDPAPASGVYRAGHGRTLEVRLRDGRLLLRVDGGPTYRLYPAGWGRFYAPGLDCSISFAELRDGVFHGLSWDSIFQRFTARRI